MEYGVLTYHDRGSAALDSIGEWPQVQLVQCSVIDIGADRFDCVVIWAGCRVTLGLLLCNSHISIDSNLMSQR